MQDICFSISAAVSSPDVSSADFQFSEVASVSSFLLMVPFFSCCVQAGIDPSLCLETQQKILMEENTQREDTKEEGVGDRQPVGENSFDVHFILRGFQ